MNELVKQVIKANRNVLLLSVVTATAAVYFGKKVRQLEKKIHELEGMRS